MQLKLNVLIIEDFAIVGDTFKSLLNNFDRTLKIDLVNNCDEAIIYLTKKKYQLVFLDLKLPPSSNSKFMNGEDIGIFIRNKYSQTKIIIITNITNAYRVWSILSKMKPEGFLIKTDLNPKDLVDSMNWVINNKKYYSKTIKTQIQQFNLFNKKIDIYDMQILYYLSKGEKTKDIPKLVSLSLRGIENRKSNLKVLLDVENKDNSSLIKEAKKQGLV